MNAYLEAVEALLTGKGSRKNVFKEARRTDGVRTGYENEVHFEGRINLIIDGLLGHSKEAWAKFLFVLQDDSDFQRFKKLSPFADQLIVAVDYGIGFVHLHGDVENFLSSVIGGEKKLMTYDADDYLVVLPRPDTKKAEVFWVGNGCSDVSGPRPKGSPDHQSYTNEID